MHTDARTLPDGHVFEADVCIVGAGAAGIAATLPFLNTRTQVLLLEGGGFDLDGDVQALYRGEVVGRPYYPLEAARLHYFGGTTGHWGGYCAPLDPLDFERRGWVPHSGWPISRATLDPYYARAHPILDLGPYRYDTAYWQQRDARRESLPLDHAVVHEKIWQFSPPTRFGSKYREPLTRAANVQLVTHANVVAVDTNDDGTVVRALRIRHFDGREQVARARIVVLACSTMQNVRLLLASTARVSTGLGNAFDQVGRYFMEHLEMPAGSAVLTRAQSMLLYGYDFGVTKVRAELQLSAATQEALGVLNATVALEPPPQSGEALSTFEAEPPAELESYRQVTRDSLTADMRATARRFDAESVRRQPFYTLVVRQEQAPNAASRVTISRDRDALGLPRARFDWQLNALDRRTMRATYLELGKAFGRQGIGRVQLRDWLARDDGAWPAVVSGGWHDMGGTRMHDDPRHGVVDANARVHGMANLYLAGAGVFTTAGAANPTLTIVALALRLADHVADQLTRPMSAVT